MQLCVTGGRIRDCKCYTDALDPLWTEGMERALQGVRFAPQEIRAVFSSLPAGEDPRMREDLEQMLLKMTEE